jgi:hypothetical protein
MADVVYRIEVTGLSVGGTGVAGGGGSDGDIESPKQSISNTRFNTSTMTGILKGNTSVANGLVGAGLYLGSKALGVALRTVGLRTGNDYLQQEINFNLNILSNLAGGAVTGFATGGIAGAVAGVAVGAVKTGVDAIIAEYTAGITRDWNVASAMETQRVMNYASFGNNRTGGVLY